MPFLITCPIRNTCILFLHFQTRIIPVFYHWVRWKTCLPFKKKCCMPCNLNWLQREMVLRLLKNLAQKMSLTLAGEIYWMPTAVPSVEGVPPPVPPISRVNYYHREKS